MSSQAENAGSSAVVRSAPHARTASWSSSTNNTSEGPSQFVGHSWGRGRRLLARLAALRDVSIIEHLQLACPERAQQSHGKWSLTVARSCSQLGVCLVRDPLGRLPSGPSSTGVPGPARGLAGVGMPGDRYPAWSFWAGTGAGGTGRRREAPVRAWVAYTVSPTKVRPPTRLPTTVGISFQRK